MLSLFWSDVVCRSQWWTLIYLLCMVLWWTPHHHDLWVTLLQKLCLTWFFSSVLDGHCYICSVWCLDEETTMTVADRTFDAPSFREGNRATFSLHVFHCVASWQTHRIVTFQGLLFPYHQDLRGIRWPMIIDMVVAIYVSLQWLSQSLSLCWEQLSLLCVFMWWTPYHPNLWGVRSSKRLRWHCEIFCLQGGSSYYHRFDCAV